MPRDLSQSIDRVILTECRLTLPMYWLLLSGQHDELFGLLREGLSYVRFRLKDTRETYVQHQHMCCDVPTDSHLQKY